MQERREAAEARLVQRRVDQEYGCVRLRHDETSGQWSDEGRELSPIRVLSGGENARLFLARMLFVSHDRTFFRGLANRVLEIGGEDGSGRPVTYGGSYEEHVSRSAHEAPGVHA